MRYTRRPADHPREQEPKSLPSSGKVTAIKAQERNPERVNVFLEGEFAFAISAQEVVTQGIRIGRELTVDEVGGFRAQDLVGKATESALRLLGVRPRAEHELRDRLKRKEYEPATIDLAIERVKNWGYLDDADFARRWVDNRQEHRPRSKRMLEMELRQKGVDRETISTTIEETDIDEVASATELARKAVAKMSNLDPVVARRRISGQLARRGFDFGTIKAALEGAFGSSDLDEDDDLS
ncbi:RecX family transcriptional regulator [soil metagenome]